METPSFFLTFLALASAIAILLVLIIRLRLPAFFSLMASCVLCGLFLGLPPLAIIASIQEGMGGLLGFIAVIVGLGSIFGALLEETGGISAIADRMTARGGAQSLPWKASVLGLIVAIPVFFDVALVILASLIHRLSAAVNRHVFYIAGPLLAGLAAAHAFIPPTPGPVAVAAILEADLGWVIIFGVITAIPAVAVAGPFFAGAFYNRQPNEPNLQETQLSIQHSSPTAGVGPATLFLILPLVVIAGGAIAQQTRYLAEPVLSVVTFVAHPFIALLGAVAFFYLYATLGLKSPLERLNRAAGKSLEPAGVVILVTGAGGAFKQILIDSGAGVEIANAMAGADVPIVGFAFLTAAIVRFVQGSATVAMITAAGLAAPLIELAGLEDAQRALAVIAVAAGATVLSHVNDSGFWLVSRYLRLTESETLRSWTVTSTILGLTAFLVVLALSLVI